MGCLCKGDVDALVAAQLEAGASAGAQLSAGLQAEANAALAATLGAQARLVGAASNWLAARWLPAEPWQPDPAWLDVALPEPPLPAASLGVISALIQASLMCQATLGIDLMLRGGVRELGRLVATLNLRMGALAALAADVRPWSALALVSEQSATVHAAAAANLFGAADMAVPEADIGPWRPFLARLKALAPLIAIGQLLQLDLSHPAALPNLAEQLRVLRSIDLPVLADARLVAQLIARASAIERLTVSLGRSPLGVPIERVTAAVRARVSAAAALLPPALSVTLDGQLAHAPARAPNPSLLANPATVQAALRLRVALLSWKVPAFGELPLLTSGAPAVALAGLLGRATVRDTPCGPGCDAARGSPGNGIGAAPAG